MQVRVFLVQPSINVYIPGGALGSGMTGMCGPKSGVWKMTLTVTLGDMKRDPYSDLTVKFETLIQKFFQNYDC